MNNYTEYDEESIKSQQYEYLVYGKETGQEGTPHLQGFIIFKSNKRLSWMKANVHPTAHFEPARGSSEQAAEYCKKDGIIYEDGQLPKSKAEVGNDERERWESVRTLARQGKFEEIPADIYVRCRSNIRAIARERFEPVPSMEHMDFHWWTGPPGQGKSRTAREENPDYYDKPLNKWWDGYEDQKCVILEDWDPSHHMLAHHLKKWADHHSFTAEVKNGAIMIRPPKIIVTSNYTIEQCFPRVEDQDALKRRFQVRHFGPTVVGDIAF